MSLHHLAAAVIESYGVKAIMFVFVHTCVCVCVCVCVCMRARVVSNIRALSNDEMVILNTPLIAVACVNKST